MDLANERLGDRLATAEVIRHQIEGVAIVQEFAHVVAVCTFDFFARPQPRGFIERELRAFDMCCVVRFEQQRALAHLLDPVFGEFRGVEKSARTLDRRECGGDLIRDREAGREGDHDYGSSRKARFCP